MSDSEILLTAKCQATLSSDISQSLLKFISIELVLCNYLILSCPFSVCLQSFPAWESFPVELALCIRWPKCWSFSFSISHSSEYSGLNSFRTDWLDLLAVQGTLKSLLQHHNSIASVLRHSAFFMVQLSHLYVTTGKKHSFDNITFVSKMISLLFNTLSRFIIAFLPKSKIFNFMVAVTVSSDFGTQENKICHCFYFFPFYLLWSDRTGCHELSFMNVEF